MSAPSPSGLSVELLLRVIDVKYGIYIFFTTIEERLLQSTIQTSPLTERITMSFSVTRQQSFLKNSQSACGN